MNTPPSERAITKARNRLADLVLVKANETAQRVGFGWRASPDAPDTYEKMLAEFEECTETGCDMRVATVNAIPSVFGSARANFAMRFWHDVTHVELDADFGYFGEKKVADAHLDAVVEAGMAEGSLPWQLMRVDTVGQNYVYAMTGGGFVPDQLAFAIRAVRTCLPIAVLEAVQQIEGRPITGRDTETFLRLMEDGEE